MGAVTLREERQSITIDSPEIVAELCSEMRFLDRELLRVVLLNSKQHLIKVVTVSQGTVTESLAHPREIFKPVITHSAYSFVMVHNHPSGVIPHPVLCRMATGFSKSGQRPDAA
jgi:DNA repair protein RadC